MKELKLNSTKKQLIDLLAFYRGATPIQLAKIIYETENTTTSNQKYIYNQLKELAKKGHAESFKTDSEVCPYLIYQLTRKGLEWYHDENEIEEGDLGEGWLFGETSKAGYFDYTTYKPPRIQLEHHLMFIDICAVLHRNEVKHRNNFYAKRSIQSDLRYKAQIIKPDGEMILNGRSYLIEIDTGSESHEQLVEKFNRYFHYVADYRNENGFYDVQNIVFVVKGKHNKHLQRRWKNILAAYYKSMRALHDKFNLQLVLLEDFEKFIELERKRTEFIDFLKLRVLTDYDLTHVNSVEKENHHESEVIINQNQKTAFLFLRSFSTPYSNQNMHIHLQLKDRKNIFFDNEATEPYLPENFSNYEVNHEILQMYAEAKRCEYTMY